MGELLTEKGASTQENTSRNSTKTHLYKEFVGDTYITLCGQNTNQKSIDELEKTEKKRVIDSKDEYCVKCLRIKGLLEWYKKKQ